MIETRGVLEQAEAIYQRRPSWITFFRDVLGAGGLVRSVYATPEELAQFERTPARARIQTMLDELREAQQAEDERRPREDSQTITVRMPRALHEALLCEAHDRRTSMNKLCIRKLTQVVFAPDEEATRDSPPRPTPDTAGHQGESHAV